MGWTLAIDETRLIRSTPRSIEYIHINPLEASRALNMFLWWVLSGAIQSYLWLAIQSHRFDLALLLVGRFNYKGLTISLSSHIHRHGFYSWPILGVLAFITSYPNKDVRSQPHDRRLLHFVGGQRIVHSSWKITIMDFIMARGRSMFEIVDLCACIKFTKIFPEFLSYTWP